MLLFEHEKTCLSYLKTQCQCATTDFNSYVYHKINREKGYLYQHEFGITCWHFSWILQLAIVKEVRTNIATYSYDILRIHIIGGQMSVRIAPPVHTSFTFTLMTTGAFSRNVGKLFSKLKFVTDNFSLYLCSSQLRSHWRFTFTVFGGRSPACSQCFNIVRLPPSAIGFDSAICVCKWKAKTVKSQHASST